MCLLLKSCKNGIFLKTDIFSTNQQQTMFGNLASINLNQWSPNDATIKFQKTFFFYFLNDCNYFIIFTIENGQTNVMDTVVRLLFTSCLRVNI